MNTSKTFCFIPAKAASTRLKKKNLLKLDGKELIYYPIRNAIDSHLFAKQDIILSTESEEIKVVAEKHGANVPYLRAEKLAKDPYGVVDVVLDFLDRFPAYKTYDSLCILLPTAPLMHKEDITKAYKLFKEKDFSVVMSVTETAHSALRAIYVRDGQVQPVLPEFIRKQSAQLESTYRINGAVIFVKLQAFLEQKTYFMKPWGAYVMPPERSVDIDTKADYKYAQFLMAQK